jgi:hypothetical protein
MPDNTASAILTASDWLPEGVTVDFRIEDAKRERLVIHRRGNPPHGWTKVYEVPEKTEFVWVSGFLVHRYEARKVIDDEAWEANRRRWLAIGLREIMR